MRVKMKVSVSGARDGQSWPAVGEELDLPDEEAAQYCTAGLAVPVPDDGVETAVPSTEDVETRELSESEKEADLNARKAREQLPPDPAAVRAWAADNNLKVAAKGKVPDDVVAAYLEAQGGA